MTWTGPVCFTHVLERVGDRDNLQGERSKMTQVTKSVSTAQYTCTTLRGVDYMYVNSTVRLYHTKRCGLHVFNDMKLIK